MKDYVEIVKSVEFKNITVRFYNEKDKPFRIGEKMYKINEEAYMNGYNWDAFLNYYLSKNEPRLLNGLDPDPEAGSYFAHYELTPENEKKADEFSKLIIELIEDENKIYEIVKNEGNEIEWD
jgi:hypothetical protein